MNKIAPYVTFPKISMAKALNPNNTNNLEESTFKFSEIKESSKKKTSSSDAAQKKLLAKSINRVENVQKYSKMLDEQDHIDKKFKEIMSAMGKKGGLDKWMAGEKDSESALVWLALKKAVGASKDPNRKILQMRESFYFKEHINQIQSSFNTASMVSKYYTNKVQARKMRKALSKNTGKRKNVRSIFSTLLSAFDTNEFPESIDVYIRSIAQDVDSEHPSTDLEYLHDIYERLNAANGVKSLLNFCQDALENLMRHIEILEKRPAGLAISLLDLTADDMYQSEIESILIDYVQPDKKSQVVFLNTLYPLLNRLPSSLWSDEEKREEGIKSFLAYMEEETKKEVEYSRF